MLSKFLELNRAEILAFAEEKTLKLAGPLLSSDELKLGLPVFYENLIKFLKNSEENGSEDKIISGAADHGKELLRLHYSLSHVVHAYGAMCQSITELAQRKNADISSQEFSHLNLCLDIAIASAVSEFQFRSDRAKVDKEVEHLGFLVHELRNALSSATVAHDMIKKGIVGTGGSTAKVLEENLFRMRNLIDRSLSEVRMQADPDIHLEKFSLNVLIDQIVLTADNEARKKQQSLICNIKSNIEMETDRQLLLSAIANLIQNALKYTKNGGQVSLRAAMAGQNIIIEVEDECGGIDPILAKNIFKPFVSGGFDQSSLGLGLTITKKAITLLQGEISIQNNPGKGCVFSIQVPTKINSQSNNRSVPGVESVQPESNKKNK